MRKLIPLDAIWEKELLEVKNTHPDNLSNFKKLISVIHTSEVLIDTFNKKKINPYDLDELQFIVSYYFAHTYHQSLGVYHLSKLGLGASSFILIRTIVESLINMSYLWQVKKINGNDEERLAWIEYVNISRYKMDKAWKNMQAHKKKYSKPLGSPVELFTNENSADLADKAKQYKDKHKRIEWSKIKSVEMRARAVDDLQIDLLPNLDLEEMYHTIYRWSSEFVHGLSGTSEMYMTASEKDLSVFFGVSHKNIDIVVPLITRVMIYVVTIVNHVFNLNINISDQIMFSGYDDSVEEEEYS